MVIQGVFLSRQLLLPFPKGMLRVLELLVTRLLVIKGHSVSDMNHEPSTVMFWLLGEINVGKGRVLVIDTSEF